MHSQLNKISRNLFNVFFKDFTSKYSVYHTLNVKKEIEDRRKRAILGGGDKRIQAQHKKVEFIIALSVNRLLKMLEMSLIIAIFNVLIFEILSVIINFIRYT